MAYLSIQADTDQGESDTGALGEGEGKGERNGGDADAEAKAKASASASASVENPKPKLVHKIQNQKSILALAVSESRIYAGTQDGEIIVWSLETYELQYTVVAHGGSILCLFLCGDEDFLVSSGGDAIINIWCPQKLARLYSIYSKYDVGDVFCVVYSTDLQTVYLGAQNTSIQWCDLSQKDSRPKPDPASHPSQRNHRFFDSKGPGGITTPRSPAVSPPKKDVQNLEIDKEHIIQYAHYGYVYCMLLATNVYGYESNKQILISGGGDGTIKMWSLDEDDGGAISESSSLENGDESVLAMALDGTLLYSGRLDGDINVWDLDTRQLIRRVKADATDILTLAVGHGLVFTGSADGLIKEFNSRYKCIAKWKAHNELILASAITSFNGKKVYVTGGNDNCVAIWDISDSAKDPKKASKISNEELLVSLDKFVSFRTVSSMPEYAEDCRKGASWLRNIFKRFGATTEMLNTEGNRNPIVYARFKGRNTQSQAGKKVLFYGHYDVVAAENEQGVWNTDPFDMHGVNGYLYGRGVSDNKGPLLAALYATAELVAGQKLNSDIVFLVEGEEECGSRGFQQAVKKHKELIGGIDWILLANSYWLNDDFPCLTYGLRGVVHASVEVQSELPDLHSGVDGSYLVKEPLKDLISLLATLTDESGRVNIPGFYTPVRPITEVEDGLYDTISQTLLRRDPHLGDAKSLSDSFKARWREPSLSIHHINTSGPSNSTVISRYAMAKISIRLVPDQDTVMVKDALKASLGKAFESINTSNKLTVKIEHQAEPWLGDPSNEIFRILEKAVMEVWGPIGHARRGSAPAKGSLPKLKNSVKTPKSPITSSTLSNGSDQFAQATFESDHHGDERTGPAGPTSRLKPLYIREGGSITGIRFLEKELNAPAAHLPCGQASDSAHLDNERLRLSNLYRSREIFKKVFWELQLR